MKYHLKNKRTKIPSHNLKNINLRAKRLYSEKNDEPTDFVFLFELSEEYGVSLPVPRKKPSIFSRFFFWLKNTLAKLENKLRERIQRKKNTNCYGK